MSVKQCSRANCENVMCGRYSHNYGYICSECFDELKGLDSTDIKTFMYASPNRSGITSPFWIESINNVFKEG
ncbi:hypothetical protein [Pseudoalteromonas virus vB_PspP-H6/1]|nr:hypothetical protein [Pseudoalteromonas virus vB_PspP-H6/1]